jgi:hypothetical protein
MQLRLYILGQLRDGTMNVDAAIAKLEQLIGERVLIEGAIAYRAGTKRRAPARLGVYSGSWVAGYDEAAISDGTLTSRKWTRFD